MERERESPRVFYTTLLLNFKCVCKDQYFGSGSSFGAHFEATNILDIKRTPIIFQMFKWSERA